MDIPMNTNSMGEISFPTIPKELITALELLYIDTCPSPGEHPDAIFYKSGQRSVVNFLIEQHKRQNETTW